MKKGNLLASIEGRLNVHGVDHHFRKDDVKSSYIARSEAKHEDCPASTEVTVIVHGVE